MGIISVVVRPLSLFDDAANVESNSDTIDIGDSVEVHAQANVTAISGSPTITAKAQHSIDGVYWTDLPGLSFSITATGSTPDSATANAYRYLRFHYVNTAASTTATFEIHLFVKTRSQV
ncbi:MAG: hypothetical protein ACE5F1_15965 [Planctomycetota bacterium]